MRFSDKDIRRLLVPLMIEQLLTVLVGLADTIMVAKAGEAAISAVSLVDTVNVLLINVFAALANGGAVVAGQFLGHKKNKRAGEAANQLLLFAAVSSVAVMVLLLAFQGVILHQVFGQITEEVRRASRIYLLITAFSIPFIALYNAGAAIFRAMGNSKITMQVSLIMNGINVAGNALLIYGLHRGVEGVAIPTTVSRFVAAVIIIVLLFKNEEHITLKKSFQFRLQGKMIRRILYIGIPNGLENSMFQLGKIVVLSLVSTFGTSAIAANAVSNTVALFQILPGTAVGMAMLAVTAQCVGAMDYDQVKYYNKKLMKIAYVSFFIINIAIFGALPGIIRLYHLYDETAATAIWLLSFHAISACLIWPLSFCLPNTLRAANDVKFCMILSILSMWICRIGASYLLAGKMGLGVKGVWIAMVMDWCVRSLFFVIHYQRGNWIPKRAEATKKTT